MIPTITLPQRTSVIAPNTTLDEYGEPSGSPTTLFTGIYCRVTRNKLHGASQESHSELGYVAKSTHIIFINYSQGGVPTTIEVGYFLTLTTPASMGTFVVEFPDPAPGGVTSHHWQVYCTQRVT